jgi:dihydrofolate reductase/thymidylate synthase
MDVALVVAADSVNGIGKDGGIPWDIPEDRRLFRYITKWVPHTGMHNCVIMGRRTFDSLGRKPLADRLNLVISRTPHDPAPAIAGPSDVRFFTSLADAIAFASGPKAAPNLNATYIIGGAQIYKEALSQAGLVTRVYLTRIANTYDCDCQFDHGLLLSTHNFQLAHLAAVTPIATLETYVLPASHFGGVFPVIACSNDDELGYLELVHRLSKKSAVRADRTGVGTFSEFGPQLTFDLSSGFPLLVSKRVPFKMVLKELLFFLSGSTDATKLAAQKVHIWDGNTTREFLDARGLAAYAAGDMGPMYGFQWRHAGAEYKGCHHDYDGQGVDQIARIETQLKEDPTSRRIILSAHNVKDLDYMALHPCHSMFQFYLEEDGALSGKLTQRSADIFLGVPFNIASYALLLHMFARISDLKVGKLIMSFGDVHLYKSHVEAAKQMMGPSPTCQAMPYPILIIKGDQKTMADFTLEDFALLNYVPGPTIRAPMAV